MTQITIGRNSQNTIVVDGRYNTVSGNHATITENNGVLTLQDHSTNGTYINGQYIHNQSVTVRQGDVITLGSQYALPWGEVMRHFGGSHSTQRMGHTPTQPAGGYQQPAPAPGPMAQQRPQCIGKYNWMYSFLCFAAGFVGWIFLAYAMANPHRPDDVLFSYVALAAGIIGAVYYGRNGNEMAWKKTTLSAEEFEKRQNNLSFIGAILSAIALIAFLIFASMVGGVVGSLL